MIFRLTFTSIFIFCIYSISAGQDFYGQWEGHMRLSGGRKGTAMNIRLELIESGSVIYGILYSRGVSNQTVYGCDYFIQGVRNGDRIKLENTSLQRNVNVPVQECGNFESLELRLKSDSTATATWRWSDARVFPFALFRNDSVVSFSAEEEISEEFKKRAFRFDSLGIVLEPAYRFRQYIESVSVQEKNISIELYPVDSIHNDSISVYLNDEVVVTPVSIAQKPLRVKLVLPENGVMELVLVNESVINPKTRIRVVMKTSEHFSERIVTCTGAQNPLWIIEYKNE